MADTAHLKTNRNELVKQYIVYDGNGRMTDVYEARNDAEDGTPCLRTQYTYDGASSRIEKRLETLDTWLAAYDI
jgi:hypothetical protein